MECESEDIEDQAQFIQMEKMSVEDLLSVANEFFEQNEQEMAEEFYKEAYKQQPLDKDVLNQYGIFLIQTKEFDSAQALLLKLIEIDPNYSYKAYLDLGQIENGENSICYIKKGIKLLKIKLKEMKEINILKNNNLEIKEMKEDLSIAYSLMAEFYQTVLMDEKNSEQLCLKYIKKALQINSKCCDANFQYSNYYLNKNNKKLGIKYLLITYEYLLKDANVNNNSESFEFKLDVVRVMIEVEKYKESIKLLKILRTEDQENIDIIYLLAYCYFSVQNYSTCCDLIVELKEKDYEQDQEIFEATQELENTLKKLQITFCKQKFCMDIE